MRSKPFLYFSSNFFIIKNAIKSLKSNSTISSLTIEVSIFIYIKCRNFLCSIKTFERLDYFFRLRITDRSINKTISIPSILFSFVLMVKNISSFIYSPTSYSRRVNRLVYFCCMNSKTMYICIYISEELSNFFKSSFSIRRHNITSNMIFTYFINSNSSFIITNSIFTTTTCGESTIIKPIIQECNSNRIIS